MMIRIKAAGFTFVARLETERAPKTCDAFEKLLPFKQKLIQARWSGEAGWIPLGGKDIGVAEENATSRPSPGEILFHPPGKSEAEILFVYGVARFASKHGALRGNHFLTVVEGSENLPALGKKLLWEGAQDIVFERSKKP
jgi:hypothetical protein